MLGVFFLEYESVSGARLGQVKAFSVDGDDGQKADTLQAAAATAPISVQQVHV
jgi:hypothetical protein